MCCLNSIPVSDDLSVRMSAEAHDTGVVDDPPAGVVAEERQQQRRGDVTGFSFWRRRGVEMARWSGTGRGGWAPTRGDNRQVYDELPADTEDVVARRSFDAALEIDDDGGGVGLAYSGPPSTSRHLCRSCTCVAILVFSVAVAVATLKMKTMTSMPPDPPVSPDCPGIDDDANAMHSLRDLDLNRMASTLSPSEREGHFLPSAHFAFAWNEGDGNTKKWRPQGITTVTLPPTAVDGEGMNNVNATDVASANMSRRTKFVLVSWYGRRDEGYINRGGRVTFVDVSEASNATGGGMLRYRHVLLVDTEFRTFPGLHLGGLSYDPVAARLLVPDSRPIIGRKILLFNLPGGRGRGDESGLFRVPECRREHFFGYAYVWRVSGHHDVSIKPSFLDYDPDRMSHVVGTFSHCPGTGNAHFDSDGCLSIEQNHILWLTEGDGGKDDDGDDMRGSTASTATAATAPKETVTCYPFFSDMQGAASAKVLLPGGNGDDDEGRGMLWVSSSYGAVQDSHLHAAYFDPDVDCPADGSGVGGFVLGEYRTVPYPPGLEDLHLEEVEHPATTGDTDGTSGRNMWMLTEYHPRLVWATRVEHLLPL